MGRIRPDQRQSRGIGTLFEAVARNPEQAVPLSYWGDRDDELPMEVEVNVNMEAADSK
jgi:hypothetical protein